MSKITIETPNEPLLPPRQFNALLQTIRVVNSISGQFDVNVFASVDAEPSYDDFEHNVISFRFEGRLAAHLGDAVNLSMKNNPLLKDCHIEPSHTEQSRGIALKMNLSKLSGISMTDFEIAVNKATEHGKSLFQSMEKYKQNTFNAR